MPPRWRIFSKRSTLTRVLVVIMVVVGGITLMWSAGLGSAGGQFADMTRKPFKWEDDDVVRTNTCRNTVQGARIVTDERGYTCRWEFVDEFGCCTPSNATYRYECRGCIEHNLCCNTFEFCVSCCLRPEQRSFLQGLVTRAASVLMRDVSDPFELCLARCRTSSASVLHENKYIDSEYKYCVQHADVTVRS